MSMCGKPIAWTDTRCRLVKDHPGRCHPQGGFVDHDPPKEPLSASFAPSDNRPLHAAKGGFWTSLAAGLIILLIAAIFFGVLSWAAVFIWSAVLGASGC